MTLPDEIRQEADRVAADLTQQYQSAGLLALHESVCFDETPLLDAMRRHPSAGPGEETPCAPS